MSTQRRAAVVEAEPGTARDGEIGWRLAFDASASPMWLEEPATGRLLAANDAALRRYGYSRQQFLGMNLADLDVPWGGMTGRDTAAISYHRAADGGTIELDLKKSTVRIDGEPVFLVVAAEAAASTLQDSEQRFRQLFEAAADGYWEIDAKGYFTAVSSSFSAIFDISIPDWLGRRLTDVPGVVVTPEMSARALTAMARRLPVRDFVHTLQSVSDGRVRWIQANFVPFFDATGRFLGYRGVSRDISAQVAADTALRESELRSRQLYEVAADWYFETDGGFVTTYLSPSHEKIFGIPASEVVGTRIGHGDGAAVPLEMLNKARDAIIKRLPFRDFTFSRLNGRGETVWISLSAMPIFNDRGHFMGLRGVGADVTARVLAELAGRVAERRLHNAVAQVSQALVVYDDSDCIVAFNKAFDDLHGGAFNLSPVRNGASFADLSGWELRHDFFGESADDQAIDLATLQARYESEAEHAYSLTGGKWMLVTYRNLPEGGKVGLWTDVTAIKRAEAERRSLEAQLQHSQRLEALGALAGGVAHEINNALVPVIALSKMMAKRMPEDGRDRRNLGTILTAAERSRDLIKQILAFSRKEKEDQVLLPIDLGAVLDQSLQMLRATLPTSIRLDVEIVPTPPVIGDAVRLQQVIINLVNNAAQAIGEAQGRIQATLRPDADGGRLRLSIADTGCGMDDATIARIFEPFFTTKPVGEGTGLGLSVVHGIIEEHGGRIVAESVVGHGTRFEICLPLPPVASYGSASGSVDRSSAASC